MWAYGRFRELKKDPNGLSSFCFTQLQAHYPHHFISQVITVYNSVDFLVVSRKAILLPEGGLSLEFEGEKIVLDSSNATPTMIRSDDEDFPLPGQFKHPLVALSSSTEAKETLIFSPSWPTWYNILVELFVTLSLSSESALAISPPIAIDLPISVANIVAIAATTCQGRTKKGHTCQK